MTQDASVGQAYVSYGAKDGDKCHIVRRQGEVAHGNRLKDRGMWLIEEGDRSRLVKGRRYVLHGLRAHSLP